MPSNAEALLSLFWTFACVVLIIGLAYWFTRHVAGRGWLTGMGMPGGKDGFQVLAQLTLGKEQKLLLVQAGERYFLLGATASTITLVAEFTQEEARSWRSKPDEGVPAAQPPSFREALQIVLKQKKRR